MDKVCIVGGGAVGAHVAGRLARGGRAVSLVARGAQLDAVAANGLTVNAPDASFNVRLPSSANAADFGPQDLVVVAVKAPSITSAIPSIVPLLGPETPVVFMLNGVPWWYFHRAGGARDGERIEALDPGGHIWRAIGPDRAIGGIVHSSSSIAAPGVVKVKRAVNRLVIGEPDDSASERLASIAALLETGGLVVERATDIRSAIWSKLVMNLATGPLSVLTQGALGDLKRERACVEAIRACLHEAHAVAAAAGYDLGTPDVEPVMKRMLESSHRPSILQDLDAGRPMEVDAIYDVPLGFARRAGIETPTLALLVAMTRLRAEAAGLYKAGRSA